MPDMSFSLSFPTGDGGEALTALATRPRSSRNAANGSRGTATIGRVAARLSVIHAGSKTRKPSGCSITK
jgi:hypothetical protein